MSALSPQDFATTDEQKRTMLDTAWDLVSADQVPADNPVLTYVSAQSAAGKSHMVSRLQRTRPGVVVDSDEIRLLHPRLDEIVDADEMRMDVLSNEPVGFVFAGILERCRENRFNVYLENTLTNTATVKRTVCDFVVDGYSIVVELVSTAGEVSRLGIAQRYFAQKQLGLPFPRWTSIAGHDRGYNAVPDAILPLDDAIDTFHVWHDGERVGTFTSAEEARASLLRFRQLAGAHGNASFQAELRATLPHIATLAACSEKVRPLYDYLKGLSKETRR